MLQPALLPTEACSPASLCWVPEDHHRLPQPLVIPLSQATTQRRNTGPFSLSGESKWGREASLHSNPKRHLYVSIITNKTGADVVFPDRK